MKDEWYDDRYRKPGVKYEQGEMPILLTIPRAYIYDCDLCGEEFRSEYKVHIPWCTSCRDIEMRKFMDDLRKPLEVLDKPPKTTDKSLCKKCNYKSICRDKLEMERDGVLKRGMEE